MMEDDKWIETYTGRRFWPLNPKPEHVDIEDIAHALSLKCRFTGHCANFYSVAQHSVLVSGMMTRKNMLWGLLHDAAEAYLPDVARPIKKSLIGFDEIEKRVMLAIAVRFNLGVEPKQKIKIADDIALVTEHRDLMQCKNEWGVDRMAKPLRIHIISLYPPAAEERFLTAFNSITNRRW